MKFLIYLIPLLLLNNDVEAQITLEDLFLTGKYSVKFPENLKFNSNDEFYTIIKGSDIILKETISGKEKRTILSKTDTLNRNNFNLSDYSFSNNENLILLEGNRKNKYRRSYTADYFIFNRTLNDFYGLSCPDTLNSHEQLANVTFSPDGLKVAFTYKNNLYYTVLSTGVTIPVTSDGSENTIINGSTDWVYEEEFEFVKAYEWSSDSKQIAYLKFDERNVKEYNLQKWTGNYPEDYRYKYPKAGENNSKVTLCVMELVSGNAKTLLSDSEDAAYIPRFSWNGERRELIILTLNRLQTKLGILNINSNSGIKTTVFSQTFPVSIELEGSITISNKEQAMYFSGKLINGNGLYKLPLKSNTTPIEITDLFDCEISSLDEKNGILYFTATDKDSENSYVYKKHLQGKNISRLLKEPGYTTVEVSNTGQFYIINYSNVGKPPLFSLYNARTGKVIRQLESNEKLDSLVASLNLPSIDFLNIKTENGELPAWILKPLNFDSSRKYPVIMFEYGGPGTQMVKNKWAYSYYLWHQYLASKGYIIFCTDGRGTGGKDITFRTATYGKLGELETQDQISAAKYLENLPYVDAKNIGIWGWSFGGYLSTMSLLKGNEIFKAAIAVAPVTNWRFYDSIYSERYLGLPSDNAKGYDENSPVKHAGNLKGKYLIIHGTSDDNVHIQNTYAMQEALVNSGKEFQTFIYPNKNHGISGGKTRYHLYSLMFNFWEKNLKY